MANDGLDLESEFWLVLTLVLYFVQTLPEIKECVDKWSHLNANSTSLSLSYIKLALFLP